MHKAGGINFRNYSLAENDTQLGHAVAAGRAAVDFKGAKRSDESGVDLFFASCWETLVEIARQPFQVGPTLPETLDPR